MNYTIYSFWLKFYSIYFGLYYSYIKKPRFHVAPLNRKGFIFSGNTYFQYKCNQ